MIQYGPCNLFSKCARTSKIMPTFLEAVLQCISILKIMLCVLVCCWWFCHCYYCLCMAEGRHAALHLWRSEDTSEGLTVPSIFRWHLRIQLRFSCLMQIHLWHFWECGDCYGGTLYSHVFQMQHFSSVQLLRYRQVYHRLWPSQQPWFNDHSNSSLSSASLTHK